MGNNIGAKYGLESGIKIILYKLKCQVTQLAF